MLSIAKIEGAKLSTKYSEADPLHEHPDCVRIAYEWLDAQKKISGSISKTLPLKHIIERWAGRYVSQSDVEVAAELHPAIKGIYPHYNISARLIEPSQDRLTGVSEAFKHSYRERHNPRIYALREKSGNA